MESKSINRYNTFCRSLKNLEKSRTADVQQAFRNKIIDDDRWIQMLKTRNQLAHDYDGTFAKEKFQEIIECYYPLFEQLKEKIQKYYK